MRLPLPTDFFAPVRLSVGELHDLQRIKAHLLSIYLSSYDAYCEDTQSSIWKFVGQQAGMKIYKQKRPKEKKKKRQCANWQQLENEDNDTQRIRRCQCECDLPALRLVGSVDGTLEDVMYGAMWLSGHERAARAHFTSDNVHDGAVLCSIVMPSSANPFRSLSVKWALKRAPHGGLVVKDRDFCYLSATGIVHSPQTGVKLGYRLRHSIIFPSCPPFQNHSVIRGQIFLCSFFRQQQNGKVLVFHEGKYDVGGGTGAIGLGLPKLIAEKSILETLLSLQNVRVCALAKKLARAVEETEAKQAVASISSTSVRESLDGERRCGMCLRRLGNALKRRCAACRHWTCSQCSVRQEIVPSARFRWMNGPMAARCFCKACVATVLRDNSAQYASQDANEDNYNVTCGRWDHDNISEEDDNDDEVLCMPNLRQSIKLFSADLQYSEVEYLSCQRGVRTLSTSLPCSTRNGYQDSVSTKQLSIGAKAMKTVNSFLPDYRRRRNSTLSVIPDLTNGGQTLERCRARYCCSTRAPDILLRSDVGRRNWASSASALSLESPQRHIDGSPIVNYHFRRSTV